jgi:hypothetical protein
VAAALLATDGHIPGVTGWQTLFLAQGATTMAFALVLHFCLPHSPDTAAFLSDVDKAWIRAARTQQARDTSSGSGDIKQVQMGEIVHSSEGATDGEDSDAARLLPREAAIRSATDQQPDVASDRELLGAWQQVIASARNPRIRYLVGVKMLKVRHAVT